MSPSPTTPPGCISSLAIPGCSELPDRRAMLLWNLSIICSTLFREWPEISWAVFKTWIYDYLLIFPVVVGEFFEISKVIFEVEREEHLDVEDEPDDEPIEVKLVRNGEHSHFFPALQVELVYVVHEIWQNLCLFEAVRDLLECCLHLAHLSLCKWLSL